MKIKIRIISIIAILFSLYYIPLSASANAADEIVIYNATGEIISAPGRINVAVISVEIPDGQYIYANPKGKGIGKATEIAIEKNSFIESWEVRYPDGEKYQAGGDPASVNIYKKNVRIPVAFTANSSAAGNYIIKADISILMCSSDACIPVERSVQIPVRIKTGALHISTLTLNSIGEFLPLKKIITTDQKKNIVTGKSDAIINKTGIPESIILSPRYAEGKITGLFKAILFGLIAGFILNFMPCVLPVVSLKVMSFVLNAGEKKRVIVTQGLLFSAGIIVSFLVLAALAAFSGYKWGALFQNRTFLIIMTSFIFAMALSLFGVFTLNAPSAAGKAVSRTRGIYSDAFIKGIMATLLATPCSGPFLGGTLAWTLTMPPGIIFLIFLSVGIGMALPYMLLALNPSWIRILPKPGIWMNYFEKAMGFLLMFTVVYLLSILDNSSRMGLVLFLLFLSIGLWQFGAFGSIGSERRKRILSFTILLVIALTGYSLSFNFFFTGKAYSHEKTPFSPEKILKNRDNGIVTVVEFTADWCPNCSLVEKISLENDRVQKLFARDDVEFMVADITQKNPEAESLMNRIDSKSIPLLAVFPPAEGFSAPLCLRDIYSADDAAASINEAQRFIKKKQGD